MWRGMWSSGRSSDGSDDPERQRCVRADDTRKRAAKNYTNRGLQPSPSLLRRETEEYDRRQARLSSGVGSSSAAGSSCHMPLLMPVKRELEELPALRMVKQELEAELVRPGGGVIVPEDFLPPAEADIFERAIIARSAREEEEEAEQRHRSLAELDVEQGLAKEPEFVYNQEAWRCEAKAQDDMYVDLVSDDDD